MKDILRMARVFVLSGIREKNMSFWVLIFPQILMIFMYLSLAGLREEKQITLYAGINADNPYRVILEEIDGLELELIEEDAVPEALEAEEIDAFIKDDLDVYAGRDDFKQQMILGITNDIKQLSALGPKAAKLQDYPDGLSRETAKTEDKFSIYFYSVVAMFSLYGYYCSSEYTALFQANQSTLAQRHAVSPIPKVRGVLAGFLASFFIMTLSMAILLFLSECILKIGLFSYWGPSLLLILGGMLFGIAWGLPFGAANIPEWLRIMIGIALTLLMAVLSGMMNVEVRQQVMLYAPWLHKINPVSLLCEGLYEINVLNRRWAAFSHLGILALYAVLLTGLAVVLLRRQRYRQL